MIAIIIPSLVAMDSYLSEMKPKTGSKDEDVAAFLGECSENDRAIAAVEAGRDQRRSASNAVELAAVPKTPPCILTILIACSWFDRSVAPQQSSINSNSNPRSLRSALWD